MAQNPISQNVIDILQSEAATTRSLRQNAGQAVGVQAPAAAPKAARGRKFLGFTLGFCIGAAFMGLGAYVYVYAADVTARFPQFTYEISAYVLWVADMRTLLAQWLPNFPTL